MHIYVYMWYEYMTMCAFSCILMWLYVYNSAYMYTCAYMHMCIYVYMWKCAYMYTYGSVCYVCMRMCLYLERKRNDRHLLFWHVWNWYYPNGFSPAEQCNWVSQRNDSISHRRQNLIKTKIASTAYLFQFSCPFPHFDYCCLKHKQEVYFRAPSRR